MKRTKRSRQVVIGNNKNEIAKRVPKNLEHHVYRLDKETNIVPSTKLVQNYFPEAVYTSLNSKHPEFYKFFNEKEKYFKKIVVN